jgi:hypothetical protein
VRSSWAIYSPREVVFPPVPATAVMHRRGRFEVLGFGFSLKVGFRREDKDQLVAKALRGPKYSPD